MCLVASHFTSVSFLFTSQNDKSIIHIKSAKEMLSRIFTDNSKALFYHYHCYLGCCQIQFQCYNLSFKQTLPGCVSLAHSTKWRTFNRPTILAVDTGGGRSSSSLSCCCCCVRKVYIQIGPIIEPDVILRLNNEHALLFKSKKVSLMMT